jgi:pimeloyl-ACP methyl ester carboxylesterase
VSPEAQTLTAQDGVQIRLFDQTVGGPDEILMLHGVCRAGRTFSAFASLLPNRFRVRAIDFRGHGQSGRAAGRYRVVDYVQDAVAAIDAIGTPVVLYGHSLGSLVAAAAASQRPRLVKAVVLEDPPSAGFWSRLSATNYYPTFIAMRALAGSRLPLRELAKLFGQSELNPTADGRKVRISDVRDAVSIRFTASCLRDLDPAVLDSILDGRWPEGYDFESIFRSVQCPVLVLRGDMARGGMLPEDDAKSLMNLLADGSLIEFPAAGHLLHWQASAEVAMQVSAFLETIVD